MTAIRARWLYVAACIAGISYLGAAYLPLGPDAVIAWKGAGVGLLAIWASGQGRSADHRLLATVLAIGAVADMVLEIDFVGGAALFAIGHVVAIVLYLRNRRPGSGPAALGAAAVLVLLSIIAATRLASPDMTMPAAFYTLFLSVMAAAALLSRFPVAAVGALLFLASDMLIFSGLSGLARGPLADAAIWIAYFLGQALIAWGVVSRLDQRPATG